MLTAYKEFWQHYFDFKGCSRRSDYWWVFLINIIIYLVLATIFLLSSGLSVALNADVDNFSALTWIALILLIVWGLTSIIPLSALAMRRIRDTGLSPFLWLVFPASLILGEFTQVWAMIISTVLAIVYLIFTLLPSKPDKIKPDSQIKGSLIVTTGLLVLIIFSVGHLPAKAEQIVYGNPTQPVVNGQVNQSFVQRFNNAVELKNDKFVVNQAKVPKNATSSELNELKILTENSSSVAQENIKEAKADGDQITVERKAIVITEEFYDTDPDAETIDGKTDIQLQAYSPNAVLVTPLANKAPSRDRVDYRNEWWGSVGISYSVAGSRKIGNELSKWAKIARNASLGAKGAGALIGLAGGPFALPAGALVAAGSFALSAAATQRENAVGAISKMILNGQAKNGLRVQVDNAPLPNAYKVTRR